MYVYRHRDSPQEAAGPFHDHAQERVGESLIAGSIGGTSSGSPPTNPPYPPSTAAHSAHIYPTPIIYPPISSPPEANITKMSQIPDNPTSAPHPKSSESPKYPVKHTAERDNSKYLPLPQSAPDWKSKECLLEGIYKYKTQLKDKNSIYMAIHSLTQHTYPHLDFGGLSHFLNTLTEDEVTLLGVRILPRIAQYAALVVKYSPYKSYPNGLPILTQGTDRTIYIGKLQVASLLACSFFCLFRDNTPGSLLPTLNMNELFAPPKKSEKQMMITQKLRSILFGYFEYLATNPPVNVEVPLLVRRQSNALSRYTPDFWSQSPKQLQDVFIMGELKMEEYCRSAVIVDFASKYLGGGVLGSGGVQEEIMFINHPELIAARFVCESMRDEEAMYIEGANRYTINSGYADTFQYVGQSEDSPMISVISIDALHFFKDRDIISQFYKSNIDRELNKAAAGFGNAESTPQKYIPICTGRWGCGIFNGNPQLKFIIQWLAASYYQRPLYFFNQDHKDLRDLQAVCDRLRPHLTISALYKQLMAYSQKFMSLYEYTGLVSNIPEYGNGLFKYLLNTYDYVFPPVNKAYVDSKPLHMREEKKKDKGHMGDRGYMGGDRGHMGDRGYMGGDRGHMGDREHMGDKGYMGDKGHMGDMGDMGDKGDKGDMGTPGMHRGGGPPTEEFKTKCMEYIKDNPVKKGKFFKLPTQHPKWKMIEYELALMHQGTDLKGFLKGIKEINNLVSPKDHTFHTISLEAYLESLLPTSKKTLRQVILPKIANLASGRNIGFCFPPHEYPKGIPIIPSGHSGEIILNKQQVACLMCCCFFGLFTPNLGDGFCVQPNFIKLFGGDKRQTVENSVTHKFIQTKVMKITSSQNRIEKLKFLIEGYFYSLTNIHKISDKEFLNIRRVSKDSKELKSTKLWMESSLPMINISLNTRANPNLFDSSNTHEIVDFADSNIGNQIFNSVFSYEANIFYTLPELMIARLLSPKLNANEAIQISGARNLLNLQKVGQTSKYLGAAKSKHQTHVCCIDATEYKVEDRRSFLYQFKEENVVRELGKAYSGFERGGDPVRDGKDIATGSWSCGRKEGHHQLRFMIQWIAASRCCRTGMLYFLMGEKSLERTEQITKAMKDCTVGELCRSLLTAAKKIYETYENFGEKQQIKSGDFENSLFDVMLGKVKGSKYGGHK